ncbi:MAG: hypothetical protein A3C07_04880 [Candidatus Sungbacteria bacterium RIFCSPHIGHO2_02_FULL_47_11]|uniref:Uncharacterized protein n=1 Tax=Candidatus Sungbacteria bacterium RIFCSPHIGHO2_02_FULL_47_11 TaxID=1802270 RepID=A0A1G2KLN0_9BACT|nr:MAG: hypothetical protein A3C07_04880 [Candidatus Sungbacteria bacterium RIFCSPHIGHO2_02_FULL_47_11]
MEFLRALYNLFWWKQPSLEDIQTALRKKSIVVPREYASLKKEVWSSFSWAWISMGFNVLCILATIWAIAQEILPLMWIFLFVSWIGIFFFKLNLRRVARLLEIA